MTNIKVGNYTFAPGTSAFQSATLTLPDYSPVDVTRLVRVYNVTKGRLIYDLSATTGTASASGTVVIFSGGPNTSKMSAVDKLEVVYDDPNVSSGGGGGGGGGTVTAAATGLPVKPGTDGFAVTASPVDGTGMAVKAGSDGLTVAAPSGGLPVRTGSGGLAVGSSTPEGVLVQPGANGFQVGAAAAGLPVQAGSNGLAVSVPGGVTATTTGAFLRDDFPGSTLDVTKWDITLGTGASQSVASSILTINSGTTAGAVTTLRSKQTFILPARLYAALAISQRIANNDVYLEMVNAAGDTRASWVWLGASASTTAATVMSTNGGTKNDGDVNITINNSNIQYVYELDGDETGWDWNERTLANTAQATIRQVRSRTVPGGSEPLYAQIRIVNGATAPASSTAVTLEFVVAQSMSRVVTEIGRGRGLAGGNDSVPVVINNQPILSTSTQIGLRVVSSDFTESTTAIAANANGGATSRDLGTDVNSRPTRLRWTYVATAAALGSIAHLTLEESSDASTWRETQRSPVAADGNHHTGEWSMGHLRYYRLRILNGAVAQTSLAVLGLTVRGDGSTADTKANMPFPLTPLTGSVFAASAVFVGPTMNLGANHAWERMRLQVRNNDTAATTYTYALQVSTDGTNWYPALNASGSAATATSASATVGSFGLEALIGGWQYVRTYITNNSATAGTGAQIAAMSLVSL